MILDIVHTTQQKQRGYIRLDVDVENQIME